MYFELREVIMPGTGRWSLEDVRYKLEMCPWDTDAPAIAKFA